VTIKFRRADERDLVEIGHVTVDTWRATFDGLLPETFLDGMTYQEQTERHHRYFSQKGVVFHVATDQDGKIIGFASGGPNRHADFSAENEVYAIYVLQAYHGRKIGSGLFRRVAKDLGGSGRNGLVVFALGNNPNRVFYQHLGGRETSATQLALGSATVNQFAYVWDDMSLKFYRLS
jgi:GNAT superfamily N-acetyltransferase